jgi:hypothetical protein
LRHRYTDVIGAVSFAEEVGRPLLTYSWEPRENLMTPNRFVRVSMRDFYYCGRSGNGTSTLGLLDSSQQTGITAVGATT